MMASLSLAEFCGPLVSLPAQPVAALPTLVLTAVFAAGWVMLRQQEGTTRSRVPAAG
jgi:hypothetical protein